MRRGKVAAIWSVLAFLFVGSGLLASIAWFNSGRNEVDVNVNGSVVEEYFHCGNGTEGNPYVITRPIHYYHLVEFFQRTTALDRDGVTFGTDYLYFQVGYDLDGDASNGLEVYEYDDQGIYTGTGDSSSASTSGSGLRTSKTLNMAYYSGTNALMPIGTNEVPFIGSFDGKADEGISISNLNIHCAEKVSINNSPVNRAASDIGVFGYVADEGPNDTPTVIKNANFDGLTIDLSDVTSTVGASQTDTAHVSGHSEAYVGYIAGHVHTYTNKSGLVNAQPLYDVYVNNASIKGGAGVCSNYGYIGKVDYIDESTGADISIPSEIDELAQSADGVGQGGSLNMADLYQRLLYYYRSMSGYEGSTSGFQGVFNDDTSGAYSYRVSRNIDINGNESITSHTDSDEVLIHSYQPNSEDRKLGTVALWNRHIKGAQGTEPHNERFMYLLGGRWSNDTITQYKETISSALISTDGEHFLTVVGTGATDYTSASANAASQWVWTFGGTSSKISTTYGNTAVYLRNNNGSLELTTSQSNATTWTIDTSGNTLAIYNGSYELYCSPQHQWSLVASSVGGYRLYNSTNYLSYSLGNENPSRTALASAGLWQWNSSKNTFVTNETTPRYLYVNRSGWWLSYTYSAIFSTNSNQKGILTSSSTPPFSGSITLSGKYNDTGTTYYLDIGSSISLKTSSSSISVETIYNRQHIIRPSYVAIYGPDTETVNKSGMEYTSSNTSIVPLNVVKDGEFTEKSDYYAARKNNGYLVSGSDYEASGSFVGTNAKHTPIRVSGYPISTSLSGSYTTSTKTLSTVYTIHSNGNIESLTAAEKSTDLYTKSEAALKTTLSDEIDANPSNSMVYGLHFMDASISIDKLVKSNYALINGVQKENYELPVDSIDFNLHENKGFVNFFAGSYFKDNDTFFSLNHIYRNADDSISNLKQISQIYTDGDDSHSYVYLYSDGTYSQPFAYGSGNNKKPIYSDGTVDQTNPYVPSMSLSNKPTTYSTLLFDTSRFAGKKTLTNNALYYFEVPIDKGEYAVGSVSGGTGAYLIYLDVGTNGTQGNFNTDHLIANIPLFTQIGFTEGTFVTNSAFNVAYVIPSGASKSTFSITISCGTVTHDNHSYTCFELEIVNTTGNPFEINCLLMDDDGNPDNDYYYMYAIKYNAGTRTQYLGSNTFTGASGGTSMTPTYTIPT